MRSDNPSRNRSFVRVPDRAASFEMEASWYPPSAKLGEDDGSRLPLTAMLVASRLRLLRLERRGDFGRLVVKLALVALRKLELAALRNGVGRDLRKR